MRRLKITMLKTKKDEIMKIILPAVIRANEGLSAWGIVDIADTIIYHLEDKGYFQEKEQNDTYNFEAIVEYGGLFNEP